jgi:serine protease Do
MSSGVLVEDVEPGGPAERAGLKPGDAILSVDGRNASTPVELSELLNTLKPRVPVNVDVLRGGKRQTFQVVPVLGESDPLPLTALVNEGKNLVCR